MGIADLPGNDTQCGESDDDSTTCQAVKAVDDIDCVGQTSNSKGSKGNRERQPREKIIHSQEIKMVEAVAGKPPGSSCGDYCSKEALERFDTLAEIFSNT